MRCLYCEVEVTTYPDDGICVHCGGRLPPKPKGPAPQPVQVQQVSPPVSQPAQHGPLHAGKNCCPKCHNTQIVFAKRGFRWGLALVGFLFFSIFGIPMGFIGSKKPWGKCCKCGHKWNPQKY